MLISFPTTIIGSSGNFSCAADKRVDITLPSPVPASKILKASLLIFEFLMYFASSKAILLF